MAVASLTPSPLGENGSGTSETPVTLGAVVSTVKLTAAEVVLLPALSVAMARAW